MFHIQSGSLHSKDQRCCGTRNVSNFGCILTECKEVHVLQYKAVIIADMTDNLDLIDEIFNSEILESFCLIETLAITSHVYHSVLRLII